MDKSAMGGRALGSAIPMVPYRSFYSIRAAAYDVTCDWLLSVRPVGIWIDETP